MTAAATASLTGLLALQGKEAALGLRWWAAQAGVALELVDDAGSISTVSGAYRRWIDQGVDILIGPYSSNLVRTVIPLVANAGVVMWNHGGAADDLAHPLVVPLPAPASGYFQGAVELAAHSGLQKILLVVGRGRFAAAVATGARAAATRIGLPVGEIQLTKPSAIPAGDAPRAVLVVGTFDEDVAIVAELHGVEHGLIASVAAGLPEFEERLGPAAEGVVGPVQWIPEAATPDIGPSGADYARHYQSAFGNPPSYVAAQATAAGLLAAEAHRLGLKPDDVQHWQTTTMLGSFALDQSWQQVGHTAHTIRWQEGRQVPLPQPDGDQGKQQSLRVDCPFCRREAGFHVN